ncbi:abscisic acid receptor PYL9 [Tanacetum coccineum]
MPRKNSLLLDKAKLECLQFSKNMDFLLENADLRGIKIVGEEMLDILELLVDWTSHLEDEQENYDLMAYSSSGSDTEDNDWRKLKGSYPCWSIKSNNGGLMLLLEVWSLVRRFDQPQKYKPFMSQCTMQVGDLNIGSVRQVNVKSGLPAIMSMECLELLDDDEHILGIKIVDGDHRLKIIEERSGTLVIESFVVDIPDGNTNDETCYFVKSLINCNLNSLSEVSERMAVQNQRG